MSQLTNIVAAEARKVLAELGLLVDEKLIAALQEVVVLEEGPADPETPRGTTITIYSDKSVDATQESLKNVKLKLKDLKDVATELLKLTSVTTGGIWAGGVNPILGIIVAAVGLYLSLLGISERKFHKADAAVLYVIASLEKPRFTSDEVKEAFLKRFNQELPDDEWALSLSNFIEYDIVTKLNNGKFKLQEEVKFERG
jgi:hypothetical protein